MCVYLCVCTFCRGKKKKPISVVCITFCLPLPELWDLGPLELCKPLSMSFSVIGIEKQEHICQSFSNLGITEHVG